MVVTAIIGLAIYFVLSLGVLYYTIDLLRKGWEDETDYSNFQ